MKEEREWTQWDYFLDIILSKIKIYRELKQEISDLEQKLNVLESTKGKGKESGKRKRK